MNLDRYRRIKLGHQKIFDMQIDILSHVLEPTQYPYELKMTINSPPPPIVREAQRGWLQNGPICDVLLVVLLFHSPVGWSVGTWRFLSLQTI